MQTTRPSADKSRNKILNAAFKAFVEKGYSATTMREIANNANVHLNLICHHFKSKEMLWNSVREMILDEYNRLYPEVKLETCDLKSFLAQLVHNRFEFIQKNPDILRFLKWQSMEPVKKSEFKHTNYIKALRPALQELQNKKQIRPGVDLDMSALFISTTILGAFEENSVVFEGENIKEQQFKYVEFIIDQLFRALKS